MLGWLWNWLGGRDDPGEVESLRQEIEALKAAGTGSILGAGSAGGLFPEPARLGEAREQERHFRAWTYAAIRPIAQSIAGQPLHVARKVQRRTAGTKAADVERAPRFVKQLTTQLEEVPNHPLLLALDNPNELMTRWSLLYLVTCHLELTGKAFVMITGGKGKEPLGLIPLPPSWCQPNDDAEHFFASYTIRPTWTAEPFEVPGDDMIRVFYPSPAHPLGATSPLSTAGAAVAADEAIQEAQRRAFANGMHPGAVITVGRHPDVQGVPGQRPILTREQRAQLIAAVKQFYRGVVNYDEPLILDGLMESVTRFSNTPQEMDFLQSGAATKARIFQAHGTNPIVAGEIENANKAQAVVAQQIFYEATCNPKIELISQCLTAWLAPRFGEDLVAWIEPLRARDPDAERQDWDQLIKARAVTINECRGRVGLPPLKGSEGDQIVNPASSTPSQPAQEGGPASQRGPSFRLHQGSNGTANGTH